MGLHIIEMIKRGNINHLAQWAGPVEYTNYKFVEG